MSKLSNIKLLKIVGEVKKENPISKYCFLLENFPIKWSPFTEHWKWYFCSSPRKGYIVLFTWTSHKRRKWINTGFTSLYIFFVRVFPRLFDNTVYLTSAERALCCTLQKWVPLSTKASIHFSPTADHCCGYGVYHLHSPAAEYVPSTSLLQKNVQLQQMTVNKVNWWWIHLASLDTWAQVDRGEISQRTALLLAFFLSMINFQYYSTLCNAIESMAWSHISEPLEYLLQFKETWRAGEMCWGQKPARNDAVIGGRPLLALPPWLPTELPPSNCLPIVRPRPILSTLSRGEKVREKDNSKRWTRALHRSYIVWLRRGVRSGVQLSCTDSDYILTTFWLHFDYILTIFWL